MDRVDKYRSMHNVKWIWLKATQGMRKNEIADMLANKGIDSI